MDTFTYQDYEYKIQPDCTAHITRYTGNGQELTIPAEMDGHRVVAIGESAFNSCTSLTSIVIPDSVTSIGFRAFDGCEYLHTVHIPASVTAISGRAFFACRRLQRIAIPEGITYLARNTFMYCKSLQEAILPDTLTRIGYACFYGCEGLTTIHIPDTVNQIDSYAFSHCSSLREITLPDRISYIPTGAFQHCKALSSVTIPDSVSQICTQAFQGCTGLTRLQLSCDTIDECAFEQCEHLTEVTIAGHHYPAFEDLPVRNEDTDDDLHISIDDDLMESIKSVYELSMSSRTTIGSRAFASCPALTAVTLPGDIQDIDQDAFANCPALTLRVPPDSKAHQYACSQQIPFILTE